MRQTIAAELDELEGAKGVRVLLAVESGSRAWGMASPDSDYDVRFVYVRPVEDYLRLGELRDTIEWRLDETLDIVGWDVRKFLQLLRGSNPTAFEWLASPIVYREDAAFAAVREVAGGCFSPKASAFHYLGMARTGEKDIAKGDTASVKKYLYVVRALLAARWTLDEKTPAPMLLADLVEAKLAPPMRGQVDRLLEVKSAGEECHMIARVPELEEWIAAESAVLNERAHEEAAPQKVDWGVLDELFLGLVRGA